MSIDVDKKILNVELSKKILKSIIGGETTDGKIVLVGAEDVLVEGDTIYVDEESGVIYSPTPDTITRLTSSSNPEYINAGDLYDNNDFMSVSLREIVELVNQNTTLSTLYTNLLNRINEKANASDVNTVIGNIYTKEEVDNLIKNINSGSGGSAGSDLLKKLTTGLG